MKGNLSESQLDFEKAEVPAEDTYDGDDES